nr:hypothetical protein [uncultured Draconibacterium sp.]
MIFKSIFKAHKSEKSGLCSFTFLFIFLFVFAACGNDSVTPEPDPEPDPDPVDTTTTTPPVDTVVVLSESDVVDYEKFYKPGEFVSMDFCAATADGRSYAANNRSILSCSGNLNLVKIQMLPVYLKHCA